MGVKLLRVFNKKNLKCRKAKNGADYTDKLTEPNLKTALKK